MKKQIKLIAAATAAFALSANAALVTIDSVTGNHGGQPHGSPIGELITQINGDGMDKITNGTPEDPGSWTVSSESWQVEWNMTALLDTGVTDNAKHGWTSFDLTADGSAMADIENVYLWHSRNTTSVASQYNIYYAIAPAVALPGTPGASTLSANVGAAGGAGDYDFASGGWTQFGGLRSASADDFETIAMGGISAQYIALEIIGKGTSTNRLGFAEFAVTTAPVPEPTTTALLGLGGLALIFRRRK